MIFKDWKTVLFLLLVASIISTPIITGVYYFSAPCSFNRSDSQGCIEFMQHNKVRLYEEIYSKEKTIKRIDGFLKERGIPTESK